MGPSDARSFAEAMGVLGETFNEPVSELRIESYFDALKDLDAAEVLTAMRQSVRWSRFFPKPAELREIIEGDTQSRADGAWGDVLKAIRSVGYMRFPAFEDERIMPAIRDVWGSWERLCTTLPAEGPELVGWIKQFKGAYRSADVRAEHSKLMSGMSPELRKALSNISALKGMP